MTKKATIGVIIPVYNEENFIVECLNSVFLQTRLPDKVLIVDNNCSDKTMALVAEYAEVDCVKERQQGIVFARNKGFDSLDCDILVKIDADSRPLPGWLEACERTFMDSEISASSGRIVVYDGSFRWATSWLHNASAFWYNKLISGHAMLLGSNYAIRRSAWELVQSNLNMSNDIWEDLDVAINIDRVGLKIGEQKAGLVGISGRGAADSSFIVLARRLWGWGKTYQMYYFTKPIFAYFAAILSIVVISLIKPITKLNYKSNSPRGY